MSLEVIKWKWGDNTLQDIENVRDAIKPYSSSTFNALDYDKILGLIIEVGLHRHIKQLEQQKLSPLIDETSVQEKLDVIYKLFCYYQDKCKDLENVNM